MGTVLEKANNKQINSIDEALRIAALCNVSDYTFFEGSHQKRAQERDHFLSGKKYVPEYDYPRLFELDKLINNEKQLIKSLEIISDNIELIGWDKAELYLASIIMNLKRSQLVMAAAEMNAAEVGSPWRDSALKKFKELNSELYGDINKSYFFGILNTELEIVKNYRPKNHRETEIVEFLKHELRFIKKGYKEHAIITESDKDKYLKNINELYGSILNVVPEGKKFNAIQCAEIMNKTLVFAGFSEDWKVVIDSKKSSPSTLGSKKRIYLPKDTQRTSDQIKGLILHEQEVHARRYFNGVQFPELSLLATGTAEYLPVEEGLGTIMALLAAPNETSPLERARQRYIHIGLALGVDGYKRDARQVFEITWRLHVLNTCHHKEITKNDESQSKKDVYSHIENIFRGTDCFTPGIVYTKAKVYYEGLVKNSKYLAQIKDDKAAFIRMFLGKYNHTDTTETKRIMRIIGAR